MVERAGNSLKRRGYHEPPALFPWLDGRHPPPDEICSFGPLAFPVRQRLEMLVRIDDPAYVPQLAVFLLNSGLAVSRREGGEMRVTGGDADFLARVLAVWNTLHDDVRAEVVR
jgi:hypothetical protein